MDEQALEFAGALLLGLFIRALLPSLYFAAVAGAPSARRRRRRRR